MEIKKIEKFTVGGREFASEEKAKEYLDSEDYQKEIIEYNTRELDAAGTKFVPVLKDGCVDIYTKQYDNCHEVWAGLFNCEYVKYCDVKLDIIDDSSWIEALQDETPILDGDNFGETIRGILEILDRTDKDPRKILEFLSQCQIQAEMIYDY